MNPIIPTGKGLITALNTIETFMTENFSRFRIRNIDIHPHIRNRLRTVKLPLPYGEKILAGKEQLEAVDTMLVEAHAFWMNEGRRIKGLRIESCAAPWLTEPIPLGCISSHDFSLLDLCYDDADNAGLQRQRCLCYSGKIELLTGGHPCWHDCLYCY